MEIIIHTQAKKLHKPYKEAVDEYAKRLSPYCKISFSNYSTDKAISFKKGSHVFVCISGGNSMTSEQLSSRIMDLSVSGISCIEFVICPPSSISINNAEIFNISTFNLSENLFTVVLTEQIYRAYTILNNITYHK